MSPILSAMYYLMDTRRVKINVFDGGSGNYSLVYVWESKEAEELYEKLKEMESERIKRQNLQLPIHFIGEGNHIIP